MIVGVLAFQGDFQEHRDVLLSLGVQSMEVRSLTDLAKVDALIIPGGESTVIAKFLEESGVGKEIIRRTKLGLPASQAGRKSLSIFGTCAGAIVLARKATGKNAPRTLDLIDVVIDRNAYGSQVDSFETALKVKGVKKPVDVAFIRAPKITSVGKGVEVLAVYKESPVLVRQGNVMIATFHPEVRGARGLHELFLKLCHQSNIDRIN